MSESQHPPKTADGSALSRQAQEAERAVLGAAILDPVVVDNLIIAPDDWLIPWHERCWARLVAFRAEPLPSCLVGAEWTEAVLLAAWGWSASHDWVRDGAKVEASELVALMKACPTPIGAAYAVRVLRSCAKVRRLQDACAIAIESLSHGVDLDTVAQTLLPIVEASVSPPRLDPEQFFMREDTTPAPLPKQWADLLPVGVP